MITQLNIFFEKNVRLIGLMDKAILSFRIQNYHLAISYSEKVVLCLNEIIEILLSNQKYLIESGIEFSEEYLISMLQGLLAAQECRDYILLADLYELQWQPFLIGIQENIIVQKNVWEQKEIEQNLILLSLKNKQLGKSVEREYRKKDLWKKDYEVEYASCGLKTIAYQKDGIKHYLHSNGCIIKEAYLLAKNWFQDSQFSYIIYGLGFGYHIKELLELDETITIKIYESNIEIITLFCCYANIANEILSDSRVELIYDPNFSYLQKEISCMDKKQTYYIHFPSLLLIKNIYYKEQLEDYFVNFSSVQNQLHQMNANFRKNISKSDGYIDELKSRFQGKDIYIVAAGPSLDKNFKQLKEAGVNSIIIAVGTVFKKLLEEKIRPDYVIIIDGFPNVYKQIEGEEQEQIPLLYLPTVYYKVVENYSGKKYLICQEGFELSEQYAKERNLNLYQSGGSVVTTALDISIQFKAKRIIFLGLDLAHTNNQAHASFTEQYQEKVDNEGLREVKDIDGNTIYTKKNLDIYRKWIENRIKNINDIQFIDATEGGAKVEGFQLAKLSDIIRN